ncbi:glycosyltransferase [Polaribacter tangerinus]|uniref:glycosyltransferase n=1 Tax=Polaribacter tangerinus TaxID=1920034 RepID=UPI000B4B3D8D|nr:glycosyltransferase [Polaribacter tangerinus]
MKKIIVAPLNWGLGHATRCVPIIKSLILQGFTPVLASDGNALLFLQNEFPNLEILTLPSYSIKYGKNIKWNLVLQSPKILNAIKKERKVINSYVNNNTAVVGIISDNRFGTYHKNIPSVYITHQLKVLAGFATYFASKVHEFFLAKFDVCWVPDTLESTFSGKLSISKKTPIPTYYIGLLSRFTKKEVEKNIDVLILLSGPEPNRTFIEKKLVDIFKNDTRNIVFVLGKVSNTQEKWTKNNQIFYNFLTSKELELIVNSAKIVLCRSGYSSIMDLAILQKKAFFIPTKNQPEQEYLAAFLAKSQKAPFCKIEDFTINKLHNISSYSGLAAESNPLDKDLFSLFYRK